MRVMRFSGHSVGRRMGRRQDGQRDGGRWTFGVVGRMAQGGEQVTIPLFVIFIGGMAAMQTGRPAHGRSPITSGPR